MIGRFIVQFLVKFAPRSFLIASIKEIGWGISVDTDDTVEGLVIGNDEYIDRHVPE